MQFTLVIFSTYKFLVESFQSSKSAQYLVTLKNSFLLVVRLPKNGKVSKNAPLTVHLLVIQMKHLFFKFVNSMSCLPLKKFSNIFLLLNINLASKVSVS
jgi:hypothetical protein